MTSMHRRKGQIAFEFILYWMLGITMVLILVAVGVNLSVDELERQSDEEAEDLASSIQEELLIAAQVEPGYHRLIDLPDRLRKGGYTLITYNDSFTLTTDTGLTLALDIPLVNGTLQHGENTITNDHGLITITH